MTSHPPRQTPNHRAKLPQPPPDCLVHAPIATTKGRTVLADDVRSVDAHRRRLANPDGYRPASCPRCGHAKLHLHDYRARVLRATRDVPEVPIARYRCAACSATFRVLPAFVARHLWRTLPTIAQETLEENPSPTRPPVPERTIHRWQTRLASQIGPLHETLRNAEHPLASRVRPDEPRKALVLAHATTHNLDTSSGLIDVASLLHAIEPAQRLL